MRLIFLLNSLLLVFLSTSCQTSPTGRKRLAFVPEGQMRAMGEQAFTEMKQKNPPVADAKVNAYVRCVADAVTTELGGENKTAWEVAVFKDDSPNAFALPGGKIGVHTGMLKVARTQEQLATVLGHEVAHVLADHSNERVSEQLAAQGGLTALAIILGERQGQRYQLLMAALGLGAQYGILLPHSRAQETEADALGLELMAKAGFDPRRSVELWRNMAKAGGGQPPEFLSTHPSHGTRIETLESKMDQAMKLYTKNRGQLPECEPPRL